MRANLATVAVLVLVATACGSEPQGEDRPAATATPVRTPEGVKAAPKGGVNRPLEGVYDYDLTTLASDPRSPKATPTRSEPGALQRSTVTYEGDITVSADKSTEGQAILTIKHRYEETRIVELSFELDTDQGKGGCTYTTPIELLHIPIRPERFDPQTYDGTGSSCNGRRVVSVQRETTTTDAQGATWKTWLILEESRTRAGDRSSTLVTKRWFSPDLGRDIRVESLDERMNKEGKVVARGETTRVLTSYPT